MPRSCRTASASSATFSATLKDVTVVLPLISNSIGEGGRQLLRARHVRRHVVDLRLPCHLRVGFPVRCGPGIGNLEALGQINLACA